jgi:hypothetical protein
MDVREYYERQFRFGWVYPKWFESRCHRFELCHAVLDWLPEVEVILVHFGYHFQHVVYFWEHRIVVCKLEDVM